jgi:hypothetical protein
MIKVDLSNAIPKRLGTYLLGIIPGLLFGLSIAFGDPHLAQLAMDRARQIYPFQPYALLILFLASCLAVGQTFFLLSWFADLLIGLLYGIKRYLIPATFGSDWLYRAFGKLQGIPPKRNVLIRSLSRMVMWGRRKRFAFEIRPVLKCQRMAAKQLLIRRYGINPTSSGPGDWVDLEWQAWLTVLGKQPPAFREALLAMRTFLGCGLAAFAALYILPVLRNRYFIALSLVFAASGCYQSMEFARLRFQPVRSSIARLASILFELAETNARTNEGDNGLRKEPSLAIDSDTKEAG